MAAIGWTLVGWLAGACSVVVCLVFRLGGRAGESLADVDPGGEDPALVASMRRHPASKPVRPRTFVIEADRCIPAKALGKPGLALAITDVNRRSAIVRFPTAERAFDVGTRLADEASSMLPSGWNVTPLFDQVDEPASRISFGLDFTNRGTPRNSS